MATLAQAIVVAANAHNGQMDKSGGEYIHHPLRVMERVRMGYIPGEVNKDYALQAAVLHDVVEDTPLGLSDLMAMGFHGEVVSAVDHLTKTGKGSYLEFVQRALRNPIARVVKYHDIADNSDPARLFLLDEETRDRLIKKYNAAKALF